MPGFFPWVVRINSRPHSFKTSTLLTEPLPIKNNYCSFKINPLFSHQTSRGAPKLESQSRQSSPVLPSREQLCEETHIIHKNISISVGRSRMGHTGAMIQPPSSRGSTERVSVRVSKVAGGEGDETEHTRSRRCLWPNQSALKEAKVTGAGVEDGVYYHRKSD